MTRPVILSVDDDREVLAAVERDLRKQYRTRYRIVTAASGPEALDAARELKRRGTPVALFLVDQRMPLMSGTQLLAELRKLFPDTKRVLLTAYADTDAAIAAINDIGLHHYLMKPWDPPEQRLYPVLDDLLEEWSASARLPYEGVRIAGSRWSPQSFIARDFLSRNQIPYQWIDIDADAPTRELVRSTAGDLSRLPVVFFADGQHLVAPSNSELAERVGLQTLASRPFYDLVIAGGGPAGLASAVYAASEGLKTLLVEQDAPGGQAGTSSLIENYLGFPSGVTGADLAHRAATQARRFGAELLVGHAVAGVRREDPYRIVQLSNGTEVSCHALVIASGLSVREIDVQGIAPLIGAGVYYGTAPTEAALYRDQDVSVVGGANSAGQGALFLSRYAKSVTMIGTGSRPHFIDVAVPDRSHRDDGQHSRDVGRGNDRGLRPGTSGTDRPQARRRRRYGVSGSRRRVHFHWRRPSHVGIRHVRPDRRQGVHHYRSRRQADRARLAARSRSADVRNQRAGRVCRGRRAGGREPTDRGGSW